MPTLKCYKIKDPVIPNIPRRPVSDDRLQQISCSICEGLRGQSRALEALNGMSKVRKCDVQSYHELYMYTDSHINRASPFSEFREE